MLIEAGAGGSDLVLRETGLGDHFDACSCLVHRELWIDIPFQDNADPHQMTPFSILNDPTVARKGVYAR